MRTLYPPQSKELNDQFLDAYSKLVYLLGNDDEETGETLYTGLYDMHESLMRTLIFERILIRPDYYPSDGVNICKDFLSVNHKTMLRRM